MTPLDPLDRWRPSLAAALRGEAVAWSSLGATMDEWLAACERHGVTALVARQVRASHTSEEWPPELVDALHRTARAAVAAEMSVAADVAAALSALAAAGIAPILFKGTALAYSVYDSPDLRPRGDTDVMVRPEQRETARQVLVGLGYREPLSCDEMFGQRRFVKDTPVGVPHALDVHWRISTQATFADLLVYDELAVHSTALPALSPHARAAGLDHALLLACVHPVMHHRNVELLGWVYDLHALVAAGAGVPAASFVDLATAKGVAQICARQLRVVRDRLGTEVPDALVVALERGAANEASAAYLSPNRRWHHELVANVRGERSWRARWQLLRDVLVPDHRYMLRAYGLEDSRWGPALLPALHLHRLAAGLAKVVIGSK